MLFQDANVLRDQMQKALANPNFSKNTSLKLRPICCITFRKRKVVQCNFAVKMVLEFVHGIEMTMTNNPILTSQRPNAVRNYEIITRMINEVNELSKHWK